MKITRWTLGVGLAATVSLFGLLEANASPFSMFILADDLGNSVRGSAPEASDWGNDSGSDDGASGDDSSSNGNGNGNGHDNNGHGNNEDGVDSSNTGNSMTGEDTVCADGSYCDDEIK